MSLLKDLFFFCFICIFAYFILKIYLTKLSGGMLKKSRHAVGFIISKPEDVLSGDQDSIANDVAALDKSIDKITEGISKFIVTIFSVVISLMVMSVIVIAYKSNKLEPTDVASFFNGVATPILTFFTFSGMLIAIIMQHIQMKTTLIELKLSRAEMMKSNESFQIQADNAKLQKNNYLHEKFENNFYSLFNSFNKIIDAHGDKKEINEFFRELPKFTEPKDLEQHVINHRSLISKVSAVNAQMLSYIREKSSVHSGDTNPANEGGVVVSEIDAQRYAELITSYVSNKILILFVLDAIFNNKDDYLENLVYFGFVERIDFKINCLALGKMQELMKIFSKNQVAEFLSKNGTQGIAVIDFFEKIISFAVRESKKDYKNSNEVPILYGTAIENIEKSISEIAKNMVDETYEDHEVFLITSFDKNFIFEKFNINVDDILKKILSSTSHLKNLDSFKMNYLKYN